MVQALVFNGHFMLSRFRRFRNLRQGMEGLLVDAEGVFNHLTDSERQWWPFGFLRPDPEEPLSTLRVALLALLQGVPLGLLLVVIDARARHAAMGPHLFEFLCIVCAAVFATNRFTLAYFWNRRAERLGKHRDRLEVWKAGGDGTDTPDF